MYQYEKNALTDNSSLKNIVFIQQLRNILSIEIYKLIINGYNFVKFISYRSWHAHITFIDKSFFCVYTV